ncbi:MAG: amidohydrolase family protein [Steroidobacteraceae bacterium]
MMAAIAVRHSWYLGALLALAASTGIAQGRPVAATGGADGAITVIHAGTLLAAPPANPRQRQTIVIRGDRVVEIRDGFVDPQAFVAAGTAAPALVDLSTHFVLPGLIDAHVHLAFQSGAVRLIAYRQSDSEQALTALVFARRTLAAGFTTVRDLASGPEVMFAVRNAIRAGRYLGPRILSPGCRSPARGGHGDFPARATTSGRIRRSASPASAGMKAPVVMPCGRRSSAARTSSS